MNSNRNIQDTYNLFSRTVSGSVDKEIVINKKISSLFFKKHFTKSIILSLKLFDKSYSQINYLSYIDQDSTVIFFNPKANYMIPLFFYWSLIKVNFI